MTAFQERVPLPDARSGCQGEPARGVKQRVKKANRYRSGRAGREKCQARQRQRACALTTRIKSLLMINTGRVSFIRSGTVT